MKIRGKIAYIKIIFLFFASHQLLAQQDFQLSQYMFNTLSYNPAYAGFNGTISAAGVFRQQWAGVEGAPQTTLITIDSPIRLLHGGAGLSMYVDELALFRLQTLRLAYSYHMNLGQSKLGLGMHAGFTDMSTRSEKFNFEGSNIDPITNGSSDGYLKGFNFDLSVGAFYEVPDVYNISFSVINIGLKNKSMEDEIAYKNTPAAFLSGSYTFPLPEYSVDLIPSAHIKSDFTAVMPEISCIAMLKKQFWGGVSYRFADAVVILAGLTFKQMNVGAAFDMETFFKKNLNNFHGSGMEIYFRYNFSIEVDKTPKSYKNSRYL